MQKKDVIKKIKWKNLIFKWDSKFFNIFIYEKNIPYKNELYLRYLKMYKYTEILQFKNNIEKFICLDFYKKPNILLTYKNNINE